VIDNTFKINCQNNAPATRKNATLHAQCTTHNAHLNTLTIFHCCCFISILNSSEKSSLCIAHYRIHYHFSMHQTMCLCSVMIENGLHSFSHTHTYTHLTALLTGLPRWAGTRKAKPIWILLKQKTVSGSDISWDICKSAPRSRQITTPVPHHSVFTGRMPFLPPNQQRQSTEGNIHLAFIL